MLDCSSVKWIMSLPWTAMLSSQSVRPLCRTLLQLNHYFWITIKFAIACQFAFNSSVLKSLYHLHNQSCSKAGSLWWVLGWYVMFYLQPPSANRRLCPQSNKTKCASGHQTAHLNRKAYVSNISVFKQSLPFKWMIKKGEGGFKYSRVVLPLLGVS